jgi:hypothetical protein
MSAAERANLEFLLSLDASEEELYEQLAWNLIVVMAISKRCATWSRSVARTAGSALSSSPSASNFDLARAAFDVGRTKTHPHRHLLLRQRARVIAKHAPSLSK